MSIEENMTREDLARDAADQKQTAHETEVMAESKEIFTGEDGDIREILREMADSEEGAFNIFMDQKRLDWPQSADMLVELDPLLLRQCSSDQDHLDLCQEVIQWNPCIP